MKLKRLAITVGAVLVVTAALTIASAWVQHDVSSPELSRVNSNKGMYYNPHPFWPSPIYALLQYQSDAETNGFHCLTIIDPPRATAYGAPFAYMFTVSYGCPGDYNTYAPLALAANALLYLLTTSLAAFGILRLRRRRK